MMEPTASTSSAAGGGFKKRSRPAGKTLASLRAVTPPPAEGEELIEAVDLTSETIEELLALRKFKRSNAGMDLERLNAGERKKRVKAVSTETGMVEGTIGGLSKGKDRMRDEPEADPDDADAKTRRIVKSNNFTGQTNAVDVDKHMMAYIEAELQKRKGPSDAVDIEKELQSLDPRDDLYKIAEKYKSEKKVVVEGNVTLSAAMLTAIPEVDLGIDIRLRNIEQTEKAKRALFEEKRNKGKEEEEFAADRFYRARRPLESDADALAKARREAAGNVEEKKPRPAGAGRREMATDDQVLDRFKKRERNHKK